MIKTDELDDAIIAALQQNGRMSNREVARAVGVTEGTIRQRLKKLETAKAIRLGLVVDFQAMGLYTTAWLRIKAAPRFVKTIADKLADMEMCGFVGLTLGSYDVVALVLVSSRSELADAVSRHVATLDGILKIDVIEPIRTAKHRYDLVRLT